MLILCACNTESMDMKAISLQIVAPSSSQIQSRRLSVRLVFFKLGPKCPYVNITGKSSNLNNTSILYNCRGLEAGDR